MGTLSQREAIEFKGTLTAFFSLSGWKINNSKSKVWFSANATADNKALFRQEFDVQEAQQGELYLGCPVEVSGRASFDYMIEKFERRLNSWKSKMLSHAGRLILIKAVLETLPVYAMGTAVIPTRVLKKLTAIMRNFYWGERQKRNTCAMWLGAWSPLQREWGD